VSNWNSFPSSIVEAESTDEFKKLFDNLNNDVMISIRRFVAQDQDLQALPYFFNPVDK